jgi:hypothetical protein
LRKKLVLPSAKLFVNTNHGNVNEWLKLNAPYFIGYIRVTHFDFQSTTSFYGMGSNRHALKKAKIDRSEQRLPGNFCLRCLHASRSKRQFCPF